MASDVLILAPGVVTFGREIVFPYPAGRVASDYAKVGSSLLVGSVSYTESDNYDLSFEAIGAKLRWRSTSVAAAEWQLTCDLDEQRGGTDFVPLIYRPVSPSSDRPIIAAIGSSSVERSYNKSTGNDTSQATWSELGWVTWLGRLCPQIEIRHTHTFGYTGFGGEVFLSNIGVITSATPRAAACLVGISGNDAGFSTGSTFAAWLSEMTGYYLGVVNALKAAGILPILVIQHPNTSYTVSGTQWSRQMALASWARRVARIEGGIEVVDLMSALSDKANADNATLAAYLASDNTHLSLQGACAGGVEIAKVIDRLFPTRPATFCASPGDTWSIQNPFGSIFYNPGMLGTGGTGTNIADNWAINSPPSGVTVTASKITDAATGWVRQRLVVSGTPGSEGFTTLTGSIITGVADSDKALLSLVAGDQLVGFCDYKVSGNLSGFRQVGLRFTPTDSGYGGAKNFRDGGVVTDGTSLSPIAHSGTLRTPTYTVINAPSAGALVFSIDYVSGQACDFTLDVGPIGVVKV